jgi:hypothetical protein
MESDGIVTAQISLIIKTPERVSKIKFDLDTGVGIQVQGMSSVPAQIIPSTNGTSS